MGGVKGSLPLVFGLRNKMKLFARSMGIHNSPAVSAQRWHCEGLSVSKNRERADIVASAREWTFSAIYSRADFARRWPARAYGCLGPLLRFSVVVL